MTPAETVAKEKKRLAPKKEMGLACQMVKLRKQLNLTQMDVSLGSGIAQFTVLNMEKGKGCTLKNAFRIARFFGKPIEEIWSIKE